MLTAAILRGWVIITLILLIGCCFPVTYSSTLFWALMILSLMTSESIIYWGNWVDFPEPVSPVTIEKLLFLTDSIIVSLYSKIGSPYLNSCISFIYKSYIIQSRNYQFFYFPCLDSILYASIIAFTSFIWEVMFFSLVEACFDFCS